MQNHIGSPEIMFIIMGFKVHHFLSMGDRDDI